MTFGNDILYYTIKIIITILGTLGMMLGCTKIKFSTRKAAVVFTIYFVYAVSISYLSLVNYGFLFLLKSCIITISIPAIITLYFLSDYSPWQAVFNYTMQLSMSIMLGVSQTLLLTFLNGNKIMDFIIRVITYSLVIIIIYKYIRPKFIQLNYIPNKNWFILSLIPIGFTLLIAIIGTYPHHYIESKSSILYLYVIAFVMLLVYCILLYSLVSQYKLHVAEYTNKLLMSQTKAIEKHFGTIFSSEENIKIMRHDMRFYLTSISQMLENGNLEEAVEFISKVNKKLSNYKYSSYCSNKTVNAVLSYYVQKAKENDIDILIDFYIPENVKFDIIDFTTMLSNALENSIIACKKIENPNERLIRITAKYKNQYIIEIANTFNGIVKFNDNGYPVTNKIGHGVGTQSILAFVKRNDIMLDYTVNENWFKIRLVITL